MAVVDAFAAVFKIVADRRKFEPTPKVKVEIPVTAAPLLCSDMRKPPTKHGNGHQNRPGILPT